MEFQFIWTTFQDDGRSKVSKNGHKTHPEEAATGGVL